jgi:hypothetical protein
LSQKPFVQKAIAILAVKNRLAFVPTKASLAHLQQPNRTVSCHAVTQLSLLAAICITNAANVREMFAAISAA